MSRPDQPDTATFLQAAAEVAAIPSGRARGAQDRARIARFADLYRAWIIRERGMADAAEAWAEKSSILLHLMVGGASVAEAVRILVKFRQSVWGPQTRLELDDRGGDVAIVVDEPLRPGPAGLVCELWPLVVTLSHLEFLAGGELDGARAEVRHGRRLPGDTANLLFGKPIAYEARKTALVIGQPDLGRAVVVRSSDIADFQRRFMHAIVDRPRGAGGLRARVATLVWNDAARDAAGRAAMPGVAQRLGLSAATLRRRLGEEGTSFQAVKADVLDQLAKVHLGAGTQSVESVAARLGYSDAHAFRRAFRRHNGMSPRDYRRGLRAGQTQDA
jgi:AraC-like DNA-binding protein